MNADLDALYRLYLTSINGAWPEERERARRSLVAAIPGLLKEIRSLRAEDAPVGVPDV